MFRDLAFLFLALALGVSAQADSVVRDGLTAKERFAAKLAWLERSRDADKRNCASKGVASGRYCERRADAAYRQGKKMAEQEYEAARVVEGGKE